MKILIFIVIIFFFCLIRYLNSDGYILENGRRTEGVITSVQSYSRTDSYGRTHVKYIVSYQFEDFKEQIQRGKFTIHSSKCGFKELDKVEISYLPNKPYKNAVPRSCK